MGYMKVMLVKQTYTWNSLSLHWKEHPRASRYLKRGGGNDDLMEAWSFTFVRPPHARSAALNPLGVKPLKCNIVKLCRQPKLANVKSPTSVTELYDKFICKNVNKTTIVRRHDSFFKQVLSGPDW